MTAVSIKYKQTMRFGRMLRPKAIKMIFKTPTLQNSNFLKTTHLVEVDDVAGKGVVVLVVAVDDVVDDAVVVLEKKKFISAVAGCKMNKCVI